MLVGIPRGRLIGLRLACTLSNTYMWKQKSLPFPSLFFVAHILTFTLVHVQLSSLQQPLIILFSRLKQGSSNKPFVCDLCVFPTLGKCNCVIIPKPRGFLIGFSIPSCPIPYLINGHLNLAEVGVERLVDHEPDDEGDLHKK